MNEAEARDELKRPLKFGDDRQIRAIRFLDAVEAVVLEIKTMPECEECQGDGRILEWDSDCEECGGHGCRDCEYIAECLACAGLGYFVTDWPARKDEVMKAALDRVKREQQKTKSDV